MSELRINCSTVNIHFTPRYIHAKLFHCFSPLTWPPWKPGLRERMSFTKYHREFRPLIVAASRGDFRSTQGIQGSTAYRYSTFILNFKANPMIRSLQIPMGRLWFNIKFVVLKMTGVGQSFPQWNQWLKIRIRNSVTSLPPCWRAKTMHFLSPGK